jgi:hypothetical protein
MMARAHYVDTILGLSGAGTLSLLAGASVTVCNQGTTTPISATLYAVDDSVGNTTKTNPFTSSESGMVEFYLAVAARVDLLVTKAGYATVRRTVDALAPNYITVP